MVGTVDSEVERKAFDSLRDKTPVGTTFLRKGEYRLVHATECGRRYTTTVPLPLMPPIAA